MFHSLYTRIQETEKVVSYNIQLDQPITRQSDKIDLSLCKFFPILKEEDEVIHQVCMVCS